MKLRWRFSFAGIGKILGIALVVMATYVGVRALQLLEFGPQPQATVDLTELGSDIKFVEANSLRFGYTEMGTGPLVLLLHGYPETARSWQYVQAGLAAKGYRSVAVFMRGFVPSSFAEEYSVRSLGKDVVALIKALGEEKAIIVGHDWGASAAYEAAFIAPDVVSHLVAISIPHPLGTQPSLALFQRASHFLYYQLPTADRLVWSKDFAHIRRIYKAWSPKFDMPEAEFGDISKAFQTPEAIAGALGYYRTFFANGPENAELSLTDKIDVPTLVIVGDQDGGVLLEGFELARPAFTGRYSLEILAGVGHFPQIEQPETIVTLVDQFVSAQ